MAKSAIPSECESCHADRSLGRKQAEFASHRQTPGVLLVVGAPAQPPDSPMGLVCVGNPSGVRRREMSRKSTHFSERVTGDGARLEPAEVAPRYAALQTEKISLESIRQLGLGGADERGHRDASGGGHVSWPACVGIPIPFLGIGADPRSCPKRPATRRRNPTFSRARLGRSSAWLRRFPWKRSVLCH